MPSQWSPSPSWRPFFAQVASPAAQPLPVPPRGALPSLPVPPASVPARPSQGTFPTSGQAARDGGGTRAHPPLAAGAAPPAWPRLPVDQRPIPPEPPRRALELLWLTWQMPAHLREPVKEHLRQTLARRARACPPLRPPRTPIATTRFGAQGEELWFKGAITLCKTLRKEVRESVRVVEGSQPLLERNRLLAMRSARLGQLCVELEQRGLDALAELRGGLARL